MRPAAHQLAPKSTHVLVGGDTAGFADVRHALGHDQKLIFPLAGLLIGIVLLLMLRAVVAPLYLMASVVLGFGATLGTAVLAYQHLGQQPGIDCQLPLIVYLFVLSIGTDYILMISRLREEMRHGKSAREAASTAIRHTGPTAAAAAVILAASFGVLAISPSLGQIEFSVAAGVFMSTFVMAWLLVPALTAVLGRGVFWPTRTGRTVDRRLTPAGLRGCCMSFEETATAGGIAPPAVAMSGSGSSGAASVTSGTRPLVRHRDRDRAGRADVPGGVERRGREGVAAVRRSAGVPGELVRRRGQRGT